MSQHYAETKYGFEWGSSHIQRAISNSEKGWIIYTLDTPKYKGHEAIQIYVTKTGKVRIYSRGGEWKPPSKK